MLKLESLFELALAINAFTRHGIPKAIEKLREGRPEGGSKAEVIVAPMRADDGTVAILLIVEKEDHLKDILTDKIMETYHLGKAQALLASTPSETMGQA